MIRCKACEEEKHIAQEFKAITSRHLRFHHDGMTIDEYKEKWPDAPLRDTQLIIADELPKGVDGGCQALIGGLRPLQQEYIAARLQCKTKDSAARMVGIAPSTVYNWKERPIIEAIIARIQTDHVFKAMNMVLEAAPEAILNIRDLQHSQDDRVALSASRDIADRAGIRAGRSETTIDITIFKDMPTDKLDREIEQMLERQLALEAQYEEIHE